ncbi:MAG: MFS transporter, partial [Bacteroidia bacterium]|nr:MFS transporter [Bacteroidia bacterium]
MLKNHPKGLLVAFFANMGERFGFYTMMAILVLFLQAKFGLAAEKAGDIYSWFYFSIYALALVGGILADSTRKYKTVIMFGIIIMFAGYVLMAVPGMSLTFTIIALFTIAFGNGLFKGNLQAVVGQMYDNPQYSKFRDSAFMIFYMGINVGAFFAPFAASAMRDWWLKLNGFAHDGSIPSLCHQLANGTISQTDIEKLQVLANSVSLSGPVTDLSAFSANYLEVFAKGYNYAFGIAAGAMVISLLVYIFFNKFLPNKEKVSKEGGPEIPFKTSPLLIAFGALIATGLLFSFILSYATGSPFAKVVANGMAFGLFGGFVTWMLLSSKKEEFSRISALILVFLVVIFFWMSFHQNGLTLTMFARDYNVKQVEPFTNIFFTLPSILAFIGSIAGLVLVLKKNMKLNARIASGVLFAVTLLMTIFFLTGTDPLNVFNKIFTPFKDQNSITPEIFQSFNPLFIVALTFPVMGIFAWLNKKGIEPSTP